MSQSQEDLLQSALSSAFTPVSIAPAPPPSEPEAATPVVPLVSEPATPLVSQEEREKWEEERAATERSWKEQSTVERKEAEERRARIAAERAATGETWEKLDQENPPHGPPNPLFSSYPDSPSPADVRDSVTGEPSGSKATVHVETSPRTTATLEHSQHWEEVDDVPSMESSYPSLSFPEQSDSTSPEPHTKYDSKSKSRSVRSDVKGKEKVVASAAGVVVPPSATLSVFDSRLSTRSRAVALFSALSINLLLPFVNGVMLGFGEIFARTLATRFGWKVPGGAVTAVGIGASNRKRS
ncbi:hypothetical protein DFH11DRAFT_1731022 [Phellopilus nigrolimitatus]|nr:hypothetical protein DFH11DRAFT_1731022 [Phellopilus nigrolimitatus]